MTGSQAVRTAVHDPIQAALDLRAQNRLQDALDLLSMPGEFSADFYTLRGDLQLELNQVKEAAGSYFTAVTSQPENVYALCNLGLCLRRLERWEDAAGIFEKALSVDPHRDAVRLDLGDCLLRLNRPEDALACFDQCWSDQARRRMLFGKAVALQILRRFDEAEVSYERLLVLDPRAEEALSNLIAMCLEVFDLERIQRYSEQLLAVNPRSVAALKGLTLVAVENRDYKTASRHFFRATELERERAPNNECDAAVESIEYRLSRTVIETLESVRP